MTPIEIDISEYLLWMRIHNYARTTIAGRVRYLGYMSCFLAERGIETSEDVTLEDLLAYQQALFSHKKINGTPLTVSTQVQRLVPVAHFFSWSRRTGRIYVNPAADMTMPRPDRRLPEATLNSTARAGSTDAQKPS
jgi:integrase/recombinase XerD